MKRIWIIVGLCYATAYASQPVEMVLTAQTFQPLKLLCAVEQTSPDCMPLAQMIAELLSVGNQFAVTTTSMAMPHTKSEMSTLVEQNYPFALFISGTADEVSWHLYDLLESQQVCGKKHIRGALSTPELAITIANHLWHELTSQTSSFDSLIAATKQLDGPGRTKRELCLIHPFLSLQSFHAIKLVSRGNNFAPRWHSTHPIIFYSQHAPTNIRLLSIDPYRVSRIITSFDGQNITPAISPEGQVIVALSLHDHVQLFSYTFDKQARKSKFVRLLDQAGDCISPSFLNEHELVFCHINEQNIPRVGIVHLPAKTIQWLPLGKAFCPAAHPAGTQIAYCKKVDGILQIFTYNLTSKKNTQITHDRGHKDECSWSPCGAFIACSVEEANHSRIAVVDTRTHDMHFITPATQHWSYPSWSRHLPLPYQWR